MDRKEFLSVLGLGAVAVACGSCLTGCSTTDNPVNAPANVDFTLDLTASVNSALKANGGSLYKGGIIVARKSDGTYIAVSQACTHQGETVVFDGSTNRFICNAHGSVFAADGSVVRGPAGQPLAKYIVTLTGSSLHVTS